MHRTAAATIVAGTFILAMAVVTAPGFGATGSPSPAGRESPAASPTSADPSPSIAPTSQPTATVAAAYATWTRSELPDAAPKVYGGGIPSAIVRSGDGYVAAGSVNGDCCDGGNPKLDRGITWSSSDGQTWVLRDPIPKLQHASVYDVVTDVKRLVAVGSVDASTPEVPWRRAAAAWASSWSASDGPRWVRAEGDVPTLAAAGSSRFVGAITTERKLRSPATARFVASNNGVSWTAVSNEFDVDLRAIGTAPDGKAVAVGAVPGAVANGIETTDMVAWTSPDGRRWDGPELIVTNALPLAVAWSGSDFLAVVVRHDPWPDGSVHLISEVWHLGGAEQPSAVRFPLSEQGEGEDLGSIYVTTDTVFAVGSTTLADGTGNAMVWVSTDGGWTFGRVPDQPAFDGYGNIITGMVDGPDGVLAVGERWDSATIHPLPEIWHASR